MSDYNVIVIGSGAAGLSAAITASDEGASVLVMEADKQFPTGRIVPVGSWNYPTWSSTGGRRRRGHPCPGSTKAS